MTDESLEQRVDRLERQVALYDLIASYGPAVDSGSAAWAGQLWAEDGTYDFGSAVLTGREGVERMVEGRTHQGLIGEGAAHIMGMPRIWIDGDHAVAVGYSQVCRHIEGRFELWRVSANRWELSWDGHAWRVERRQAYLLDGQETARALLGSQPHR